MDLRICWVRTTGYAVRVYGARGKWLKVREAAYISCLAESVASFLQKKSADFSPRDWGLTGGQFESRRGWAQRRRTAGLNRKRVISLVALLHAHAGRWAWRPRSIQNP